MNIIDKLENVIDENDKLIMFRQPLNIALIPQIYGQSMCDHKPYGLWYSCGLEWIKWILENEPTWFRANIYKLYIDDINILKINDYDAIEKFNKMFRSRNYINWDAVSKHYHGIEICPYMWKYRHVFDWYYTWDVASGCIWNRDTIISMKQVNIS